MDGFLLRAGALIVGLLLALGEISLFNRVYLRFENVAMGSMIFPPDGRGGFTTYRSRDGIDVIVDHFDFPSQERANAAFQSMLRRAERIFDREVLYDREGKLATGERVVITLRAESGVDAAAVISLDDTNVYEIASTSLRHALSFERAHRRF